MSINVLSQLQELQQKSNSNERLNPVVLSFIRDHSKPLVLVKPAIITNGKFTVKPVKGVSSLLNYDNRYSKRKVTTLNKGNEHITDKLNNELLGGESYPVLTAVFSAAGGYISTSAGLIFSAATTTLNLANTASKVLARTDDEIWHIEEIGKVGNKAIYVSAFFIIDPYRKHTHGKGWLIHEERKEVALN